MIRIVHTLQPRNRTPISGTAFATTSRTTAPTDDPIRYQLMRRSTRRMLPDGDGALLRAPDQLDLVRAADRTKRGEQVVAVGDRLAGRLDDQVAGLDAGRRGRATILDAPDQDAVTIREPDRTAQSPGDVRRRDRDAEAGAGRRDRKSTRLNSSHLGISYAVFC